MLNNLIITLNNFYQENIVAYAQTLYQYPIKIVTLILDIAIVAFLAYKLVKIAKGSRAWQLVKGIAFILIITWVSGILNFNILNGILTNVTAYGVTALLIIFQPELRRALEQLGGTNKLTKFFGMEKDIITKTKEDIYKIAIAAVELSKTKTGGLIVIERDIEIKDIIATGIEIDSQVSPQLLVNLFTPKTPLHDGAVVISNNKIVAAACMLPLAGDADIAKELGTRHRAAIGISKESDAIAVVVSEETGKISIAKDGTLIADVKEDALKKILIKSIVTSRMGEERENNIERIKNRINKNK
ncbi:MAG: diadenylate cyclase CdaA [Clostridia bacterium]|nr:diadenylate cyclase CdaA [Clostridia bacterium]